MSFEALARTTVGVGPRWVACDARPDNPHYSVGARGAIYKVRVICEGSGYSNVQVQVNCTFKYRSFFSTGWQRSISDTSQTSVKVNGGRSTVYCPKKGSLGVGTGYWQGSGTFRIVSPGTGTWGTFASLWRGNISS